MSGRNRGGPPLPMKGGPHAGLPPAVHEPPFGRGLGPIPHPALLEEMRESTFGMGPRSLPPHPAIIQDRLDAQYQDLQGLLVDNQRLAATHVALKQELEATQHELQRMGHIADSLRAEKDVRMRELYEKSVQLEVDLRGVEAMRGELHQVRADIKEFSVTRQELTGQVQAMTQDLARLTTDLQQAPALRAEIETMKQELQRAKYVFGFDIVFRLWFCLFLMISMCFWWHVDLRLSMRRKDMQRIMNMVRRWRRSCSQWLESWRSFVQRLLMQRREPVLLLLLGIQV
jgi:hypothetical protein